MVTPSRTRVRPSLAAEDLDLAQQVGDRLKAARKRAGLTQRELAEPRYTKAYISALENGLIKPSMAALRFLARQLGTVPAAFLADEDTHWQRLDAEIRLARRRLAGGSRRFIAILDRTRRVSGRGLCLLGLAEASFRLGQTSRRSAMRPRRRSLLKAAQRDGRGGPRTGWPPATTLSDDSARARSLLEGLLAAATL